MQINKTITRINLNWLNTIKIIFIIFFLLFIASRFSFTHSDLNKAKSQVLRNGNEISSHLFLSDLASEYYDWSLAQKELMKAYSTLENNHNKIAGITSHFEATRINAYAEYYLLKEIDYWTNVVQLQPEYLDGYLKLSLLYFKSDNLEIAKEFWRKALTVDPNSQKVYEIGKALKFVVAN